MAIAIIEKKSELKIDYKNIIKEFIFKILILLNELYYNKKSKNIN